MFLFYLAIVHNDPQLQGHVQPNSAKTVPGDTRTLLLITLNTWRLFGDQIEWRVDILYFRIHKSFAQIGSKMTELWDFKVPTEN